MSTLSFSLLGRGHYKKPGSIAQSKGNKLKQILGESGCKVKAAAPLGFQQIDKLLANFPKGTKVVHRQWQAGYIRDDWSDQMTWVTWGKDHTLKSLLLVYLVIQKHS